MIVVLKFSNKEGKKDKDAFIGVLGVFSSWEQAEAAAAITFQEVTKPADPESEAVVEPKGAPKLLAEYLECRLFGVEMNVDDLPSMHLGGKILAQRNL